MTQSTLRRQFTVEELYQIDEGNGGNAGFPKVINVGNVDVEPWYRRCPGYREKYCKFIFKCSYTHWYNGM